MFRRFRNYQRGEFIVVGVDTSAGGPDYCAAQFLSKTKKDVPVVYHAKVSARVMNPFIKAELEKIYDETGIPPVVAYERNNGGLYVLEELLEMNELDKYVIHGMIPKGNVQNGEPKKIGWDTNTATRPIMLQDLKEAIDNKLLTVYDKPTISEMFSFVVNKTLSGWKAQAEQGSHDDLIMSLAIAWQLHKLEETPEPDQVNPYKDKIPGTYVKPLQEEELSDAYEQADYTDNW